VGKPFEGTVSPKSSSVGIRVVDKRLLKDRHDDVTKRMMHDPVAVGSGRNQASFGFFDPERFVFSRLIGFGEELMLELG
jgi:hypothetical protein